MSQNRSTAVMQRRVEAHDSLDDFPTPPWATRALLEFLADECGLPLETMMCREPCANRGFMVRPLLERFGAILASDVHDYGAGFPVRDYLFGPLDHFSRVDFTCMNPPFRLAEEFIAHALANSRIGCAAILRIAFLEGDARYRSLFAKHPPSYVLQFVERVVMLKGQVLRPGTAYLDRDGEERKAGSATAYAWFVWLHDQPDSRLRWIEPCRARLEREGDYTQLAAPAPQAMPLFAEGAA
jgi:hypothetical protein